MNVRLPDNDSYRMTGMLKYRTPCYAMALLLVLASSCSDGRADTNSNDPDSAEYKSAFASSFPVMEYRIGPSDILSISVWKHDGMNRTVTVRPDGMISFPLLEDIRAAGLTPMRLRDVLVSRLKEYIDITDREVSIIVQEVHSYTVSVLGEVNAPGRFEFQSQVTVLDALAEAGGFTDFASRSNILILRTARDGINRIRFNYDDVISSGIEKRQLTVYPGDIILVP